MTKIEEPWTSLPLRSGDTDEIQRPLIHAVFSDELFREIVKLENHGVAEVGSHLDRFQQEHYPFLGPRTALTLMFVTREIYKECAWRYLELVNEVRAAALENLP